jgi:hypothetical protein
VPHPPRDGALPLDGVGSGGGDASRRGRSIRRLRTDSTKRRDNYSEKIEKLSPAEADLAQYRTKRWREIVPMNGHDRLAAGIIPVPQETTRPLGSGHLKAGPLQCRNDDGGPRASAALSCVRVSDRHELVDRRGEIPIGGRNGLAIPRRENVPPQEAHRELTPPQTGNPLSPSYYLIFTALVSLAALIAISGAAAGATGPWRSPSAPSWRRPELPPSSRPLSPSTRKRGEGDYTLSVAPQGMYPTSRKWPQCRDIFRSNRHSGGHDR